jgi:hypothetical protein
MQLFAEFSDKSNQARAFSFFAFASNFGIFLGGQPCIHAHISSL